MLRPLASPQPTAAWLAEILSEQDPTLAGPKGATGLSRSKSLNVFQCRLFPEAQDDELKVTTGCRDPHVTAKISVSEPCALSLLHPGTWSSRECVLLENLVNAGPSGLSTQGLLLTQAAAKHLL